MAIERLAFLSVHTSPLAMLGSPKAGGMNAYVRELALELGRRGIGVDIFTRRISPLSPKVDNSLGGNIQVVHILAGPKQPLKRKKSTYIYLSLPLVSLHTVQDDKSSMSWFTVIIGSVGGSPTN